MCFRIVIRVAAAVLFCVSCSQYRKIEQVRSGQVRMSMGIPQEDSWEDDEVIGGGEESSCDILSGEPFVMNAVWDEEAGEMVATDILNASSVTARFRNVAERAGYVTIGFDINVPSGMADSKFRLKLYPKMIMQEDTSNLDALMITGARYREGQLRGYERYRRFLSSIVTDTTDFIRIGQLEVFLKRHFPETYKMKNDSSLVSDPQAETLFGATQEEALRHYTRQIRRRINDRRMERMHAVFRKYVKDPIVREGVRLDTVFSAENGDFVYSYLHTFRVKPFLRKVIVTMSGFLFAEGRQVAQLPKSDDLEFYISSLSSLADESPKYKTVVIERKVFENARAYLDFKVGSAQLDTAMGDNAVELQRVRKCIEDVFAREEYVLDSLLIVASCSPEGSWRYNEMLAARRSNAILEQIREYVTDEWRDSLRSSRIPENWGMLRAMVETDTLMNLADKREITGMIDCMTDPDKTERQLNRHPRYAYLKEKLYPKLRCVSFDFHLHRTGMVKDTIHTSELDTLYMSGVAALKNLDYQKSMSLLGPYGDYNAALAYLSGDRNYSALEVLKHLDRADPKVCYLMAIVLSRLGHQEEALKYYRVSKTKDSSFNHRANLDPELSGLLKLNNY